MMTSLPVARAALKAALQSAADRFEDPAGLDTLLARSLVDLSMDAPHWQLHMVALQAGVATYAAPAEALRAGALFWGTDERVPQWAPEYAGPKPRARLVREDGAPGIEFDPSPTAKQIRLWGSTATVRLAYPHVLDAETSTLTPSQGNALLLRAQAEAMRTLAASGVVQPIQRHQGLGASLPTNSTPRALLEYFLHEYREAVRRG